MFIAVGLTLGGSPTEKDLRTYRILSLVAAGVILGMGLVHRFTDPTRVDPLWERVLVAAACLAGGGLTYLYRRDRFHWIAYAVYAVVTAWILHLTVLNHLAPEYGLGLFLTIAAVSALFRTQRHLLVYIAFVLSLLGALAFRVESPRMAPSVLFGDLVAICVLSYVILGARLRTQAELAASEERYALAARGSNDGLWDWDLHAGRVYFSPRWKAMLGYAEEEIGDTPDEWLGRVHPEDVSRVLARLRANQESPSQHFEIEHRVQHRDGGYRWMLARGVAIADAAGRSHRMAGSQTDVTEQKRVEEQLVYNALHDPLTGLPNRALLMDRLALALRRGGRRGHAGFAVFFIDLDRFKVINDGLGHAAGDRLLVAVAQRLQDCLRMQDTVARIGGDEFAVVLEEVGGAEEATLVAERIQAALGLPFAVDEQEVFTSASIGITLSEGYERPGEMLRDADTAMYRAKAAGRARYEIFDPEMQARAAARLRTERELRYAVQRGELRVHYQPIISLEDGTPRGFEALVRWQHPERGLLFPDEFVPLAEETGLIVPLGEWVLREACRQLRAWQEEFPLSPPLMMSVNLSARQFAQPDLARRVDEVVQEFGIAPGMLQLELTESLLMEDAEGAVRVLSELESRGVHLAIDDFGTGYSSLSYLQKFPISTLKIDRSFVQGMAEGPGSSELVEIMVALARSLGVSVVAEGVETEEQRAFLRELGCERAQGYLFARALELEQAAALLAERGTVTTSPQR